MRQALTSKEVWEKVDAGQREFWSRIDNRMVTLCGRDFDDGCTAYGQVWDAELEDWEKLDMVDVSCLDALTEWELASLSARRAAAAAAVHPVPPQEDFDAAHAESERAAAAIAVQVREDGFRALVAAGHRDFELNGEIVELIGFWIDDPEMAVIWRSSSDELLASVRWRELA